MSSWSFVKVSFALSRLASACWTLARVSPLSQKFHESVAPAVMSESELVDGLNVCDQLGPALSVTLGPKSALAALMSFSACWYL